MSDEGAVGHPTQGTQVVQVPSHARALHSLHALENDLVVLGSGADMIAGLEVAGENL